MKVQLLPSAFPPGSAREQYLTTYLINDGVAVDAGSLGLVGCPADQARVRHVVLTHAHLDHIASLPIFLDNIYELTPKPVTIHTSAEVWRALRVSIFNNKVWPDLFRLKRAKPFFRARTLTAGKTIKVEGLRITPIPVSHAVPTLGLIIEDARAAIVIPSDTGPTEEIWRRANRKRNLAAVFLELSYPNARDDLGQLAKHLTPATFAEQLRRLTRPVPVYAVHRKPNYLDAIEQELKALNLPQVSLCGAGEIYTF
jgi:cAMP phosphodiesterase